MMVTLIIVLMKLLLKEHKKLKAFIFNYTIYDL